MPNRFVVACALLAVALSADRAEAHAVHVKWKIADTDLVVVAFFDEDMPVEQGEVTLRGTDGEIVATGKTDDTGLWKCPMPAPGTYQLTVRAFGRHEKTVSVEIAGPLGEGDARTRPGIWWWIIAGAATAVVVLAFGVWMKRRSATGSGEPHAPH